MKGEYTIDIERPRADVFAFLSDQQNMQRVEPTLIGFGVLHETPEKVGSTFWLVYQENDRTTSMSGVVTAHEHPENLAIRLDHALFSYEAAYHLAEIDAHTTRLVFSSRERFKHVYKLIGVFAGRRLKAESQSTHQETFARIKDLIESERESEAPASTGE
ncbi:MAG: SRPBCC family protein [Planctomycetota bacterium]